MSDVDAPDTTRLVEAAAAALARARNVWLATSGAGGGFGLRPMGRTPPAPGDDPWSLRFITDDRSRKVVDIGRDPDVSVTLQYDAEDAFLIFSGKAVVRLRASEDAALWRESYAVYYPDEGGVAHAAFFEMRIERMELWMRGVTPEPFGRSVTLARDAKGGWRRLG